jgi:hypothetical protein
VSIPKGHGLINASIDLILFQFQKALMFIFLLILLVASDMDVNLEEQII